MDWVGLWDRAQESWWTAIHIGSNAVAAATPFFQKTLFLLSNPWARGFGLLLLVYFTIRVIASVYSGDKQNSQMGPIGIRPHAAQRLDRSTIVLPRHLMPMNMDGVSADLKIFYNYVNSRGRPCKELIHTHRNVRLAVSPVKLNKVATTIYGQEIPDVATEDVCFPAVDVEQAPASMPATPERAQEYAVLHRIIENWVEDDEAPLVSLHADEHETVKDARAEFLVEAAQKVAKARGGNAITRWLDRGIAVNRPNVVGTYYLKFEFSHEPWFVLTKHPDRDLKMTAWLTVLTSVFALAMDAWPKAPPPLDATTQPSPTHESSVRAPAPPRLPR